MKFFGSPRAVFLAAVSLFLGGSASARTWTDNLNRTWQGEFVRVDGPSTIFLVDGKKYPFPLARLSAADKVAIFKLRQVPPAHRSRPGLVRLAGASNGALTRGPFLPP